MSKSTNQRIADLAITFAEQASKQFPDTDIGALKIQLAAGLLKAIQIGDIINRLFTDDMVDQLFPNDDPVDPDDHVWDLV